MKYKVAGYVFVDKEKTPIKLKEGVIVDSWAQAHDVIHLAGFENYLITISPVEEDD